MVNCIESEPLSAHPLLVLNDHSLDNMSIGVNFLALIIPDLVKIFLLRPTYLVVIIVIV